MRCGARFILVGLGLAWFSAPQVANAAGFSVARFGAEKGHPTTDNPTAIYYNPAGLALGSGHRIFIDGTLAVRGITYNRPASAITDLGSESTTCVAGTPCEAESANAGEASLLNFAGAPFVGAATDLGIEGLGLGFGFFVPFGGGASWSKNEAYAPGTDLGDRYPGGHDGQARWFSIDGNMRSIYVSLGAAYTLPWFDLSVGVVGNLVLSQVETLRARTLDGTDDLINVVGDLKEGRSLLEVSGVQGAFGVGAIWQPTEELFVGFSYQSRPNISGGMELRGQLTNLLGELEESVTDVVLTQDLPDIIRLGARYRFSSELELRLFGDWTRWSAYRRQCIMNDVETRNCTRIGPRESADGVGGALGSDGSDVVAILERGWEDSFGVRAGASYWLWEELELQVGGGYDSNAVPDRTLDPALIDMDKGSISLGASYQVFDDLTLAFLDDSSLVVNATFTQVIYADRNTEGRYRILNAPSTQPDGSGVYSQFVSVLNLGVEWAF